MPFELGIIRNHYVGRTFIEPTDHIRHLGVKLKHSANRAGAGGQARHPGGRFASCAAPPAGRSSRWCAPPARSEVHMRISSPPTTHSCFYGIDTPEREQAAGRAPRRRGDGAADRRRQPGLHLDRRPLPRDGQARRATRRSRNTAMPASPATIRSRCPTTTDNARTAQTHACCPKAGMSAMAARRAASPSSPAPAAASARRSPWRWRARGRACGAHRPHRRAGWRRPTTRSAPPAATATLLPLDLTEGDTGRRDRPQPVRSASAGSTSWSHAAGALGQLTPVGAHPCRATGPTWSAST